MTARSPHSAAPYFGNLGNHGGHAAGARRGHRTPAALRLRTIRVLDLRCSSTAVGASQGDRSRRYLQRVSGCLLCKRGSVFPSALTRYVPTHQVKWPILSEPEPSLCTRRALLTTQTQAHNNVFYVAVLSQHRYFV